MPELDALDPFERRFAAAYRRYLDEVPTAVDAVGVARAAAIAPRARRVALPWTLRPMPRLAWLLLLAALLLAALGAAALFVGSQRHGIAFACLVGSTPDEPGPADQARPAIGDGVAAMVFDRRAGKIVLLAQIVSGPETWTFDVCTNTWTRMHPDQEPAGPVEAYALIYDVDSDLTIAAEMGKAMWAYDLEADAWTRKGVAPAVADMHPTTGWAYDPVSGLVIVVVDDELWSYDVEIDRWALIAHAPWSRWAVLAYDTSVDRIVAYTRHETWLLDVRTGTWTRSGAGSPEVYTLWGMADFPPGILYDAAAEKTMVADLHGRAATYDATEDRWEILDLGGNLPYDAFDPVNRRLVGHGNDGSLVAFDLSTREWIVLLQER